MRYIYVIAVIIMTIHIVYAQSTPTPAPSKTPNGTSATNAPAETHTLIEPYSQEDLSVMVANVQRPNGIVWLNDMLYIICSGDWTIYEVNAENGRTITFVSGVRDAHQIHGENTDTGFDLWIPDYDTNRLLLVTEQRSAPRAIATTGLNGPWGIVKFSDTEFLISNLKLNNIVMVNRDGNVREAITGLRSPTGLVLSDSSLYIANNGSARRAIEWLPISEVGQGNAVPRPLVSGLQSVSNLVLGSDGYLYFTFSLGTRGVVGRVQPETCEETGCTNEQVEIVVYSELPAPLAGLTVSPESRLYIHTIYRPELYWVDLYQ